MTDALKIIAETPIPTILVVAGIVFLLLSFADKVYGQIAVSEKRRIYAFVSGAVLVAGGLGVNLFASLQDVSPTPKPDSEIFEPLAFNELARPGFNCGKYRKYSKTHVERAPQTDLVCVFVDLATADRRMTDYFRSLMNVAAASASPEIREGQRKWLNTRRSSCPTDWSDLENTGLARQKADCLVKVTEERIEHLKLALEQRELEMASN